jgi:hypothetical protein
VTGAPTRRTILERAQDRIRFGLVTQELLDRLASLGLLCYPYMVVEEPLEPNPELDRQLRDYTVRQIGVEDVDLIASMACRRLDVAETRRRLDARECFGLFQGSQLLGYTWAKFEHIGSAGHDSDVVGLLPPASAYLFDAYVARAARGRAIAPVLRYGVQSLLAARGRRRFFSITLLFNASSRRFKRKLGAIEFELRLILGRPAGRALDLRLWRREPRVRLPGVQLLRPNKQ